MFAFIMTHFYFSLNNKTNYEGNSLFYANILESGNIKFLLSTIINIGNILSYFILSVTLKDFYYPIIYRTCKVSKAYKRVMVRIWKVKKKKKKLTLDIETSTKSIYENLDVVREFQSSDEYFSDYKFNDTTLFDDCLISVNSFGF